MFLCVGSSGTYHFQATSVSLPLYKAFKPEHFTNRSNVRVCVFLILFQKLNFEHSEWNKDAYINSNNQNQLAARP